MNTSHDRFEEELRAVRPSSPSLTLTAALSRALDDDGARTPPHHHPQLSSRLIPCSAWIAWGAAAVMAVALIWPGRRTPVEPPLQNPPTATETPPLTGSGANLSTAPRFTPVSSSTALISTRDEGVVYLENGMPARKVRLEFLDTVNLRSTDNSRAVLNVSYPCEEIRLVPVQTF